MKLWLLCLLPFFCGCASIVKELKSPPHPYAVTHHTRVVGIEATVPNQAGDAVFKLRLGFFSDVTTLLPCATNQIYIPAFSDRFRLGESGLNTSITEELNTGWRDQPPAPMLKRLIEPDKQSSQGSQQGHAFAQKQALAGPEHPRSASVGALDSFAPVFALQFGETDRKPIAVLELNSDSAINTYSVIGSITYTNTPPAPK